MKIKDFVKIKCPTCKNRNKDLCKIVLDINGEPKCEFLEKEITYNELFLTKIDEEGYHFKIIEKE